MNQIFIKNYIIEATHGYYKEEHYKPQRFITSVTCNIKENKSGSTDELNDTLNYEYIRMCIDNVIRSDHHKLLESLSEDIASLILENNKVLSVEVEIIKPDIWGDCEPGVHIVRGKL